MAKIAFYTLGCKSNQFETGELAREARARGFEVSDFNSPADIYVINTCTVTQLADRKSRRAIRLARRKNPDAKLIVTGCYADISPEEIPEADLIVKNNEKTKIMENLFPHPIDPNAKRGEGIRVRENLMIENGCEEFCKYCVVPFARGKVKSKPADQVIKEAVELVRAGAKEIVLTGINLGACGPKLPMLIKKLAEIEGLLRIRLSSIEPMYITDELIEAIKATPKVCRHLHIPMQSGSTKTLKAMGRRYTAKEFAKIIKNIRRQIPDVTLNTDVIVGFPGETEEDLEESMDLMKELKFGRIHPFHFSPRPKTAAFSMKGRIDPKIVRARADKMHELRLKLMKDLANEAKRSTQEVLVECRDKRSKLLEGLTESYLRVLFKGDDSLIGHLVKVRIKALKDEFVTGEAV